MNRLTGLNSNIDAMLREEYQKRINKVHVKSEYDKYLDFEEEIMQGTQAQITSDS